MATEYIEFQDNDDGMTVRIRCSIHRKNPPLTPAGRMVMDLMSNLHEQHEKQAAAGLVAEKPRGKIGLLAYLKTWRRT